MEFPTPGASQNYAITGGPNNNVSDTESAVSNRIGSMTFPGGYSYIQVNPSGASPYGIVQDGPNLWVLERFNNNYYIARYGQGSNYYPVSGTPNQITADSQGNLWYTQANPGALVELDPNNPTVPVSYEPPGSGVVPYAITVGGDGGIWVTASTASGATIDRFDPKNHSWKTFALPSNYGAYAITATSFGVGFTLNDGSSYDVGVLKYDMSSFQHHAIPPTNGNAGIACGPDGNLWFTDGGDPNHWTGGRIGWASSVTGTFLGELPVPVAYGSPRSITRGWIQAGNIQIAANTLWFTDQQGYIGRIDFPPLIVHQVVNPGLLSPNGQMKLPGNPVNDLAVPPRDRIGEVNGMSGMGWVSNSPALNVTPDVALRRAPEKTEPMSPPVPNPAPRGADHVLFPIHRGEMRSDPFSLWETNLAVDYLFARSVNPQPLPPG
jgi:streptogramin lyase